MPWGRSLLASAIVVACAICAPAKAQVFDQPGGDVQWVRRVPLALPLAPSVRGTKILGGASADAVYSNLKTFRNQSFAAGGATLQLFNNTITRMAADDLNLVGTPPYSVNGFRFIVTNLNAVPVCARPLVRFYLPNGPGGGPGTLIEARTYSPTKFDAGVVGTIKTSSEFVLRSSHIWAGIAFDNNNGIEDPDPQHCDIVPIATAAQLDNLALGIFSPPDLGTSTDQYFVTTAAGSIDSDNPVGAIANFGGAPPADFGWEILTAQNVDLSITVSDGVATAFPGGSVVYTIIASNAGPDTVFDARVVDSFPAILTCSWTCAGSAGNTCAASGVGNINDATVGLAVGGSATYTATCAVSTAAAGTLVNTAAIFAPGTAVEAPANIGNNTATDSDAIGISADLAITNTDGVTSAASGGSVTYTITASNAGPSNAPGATVSDTFPAALTCTWTCVAAGGGICTASGGGNLNDTVNLPVGGTVTYAASCAIAAAASGTLTNTATVAAPAGALDPVPGSNSATDSTTVVPGADLTIAKSHTGNFTQGQTGTYTLAVSNLGGTPTSGSVTIIDDLPVGLVPISAAGTGWTCNVAAQGGAICNRSDALAPGASYPSITLTVAVAINAPTPVTNTAVVFGGGETNPSNNTATDPTTIAAGPDLAIAKTHAGNFTQGQIGATYTLAVSNTGGAPTSGSVTVEDNVPVGLVPTAATGAGWTCTVAAQGANCNRTDALGPGASYPPITLTVAVANNAAASVTNTAIVFGGGETNPSNDTASDPTTITAGPDPTIAKSHTGNFTQGQIGATYTLTVSNIGGSPISGTVTVNDNVPVGLVPTSATGAGWTCNIAAQGVTCTRSDPLAPAASYPSITLTVTVAANAPALITNTVTVIAGGDVNSNNDSASDPTTIIAVADLTLVKTHTGSFQQGQVGATYTLTVSNIGSGPSSGTVTVTDTLPAGLTPTAAAGTGWVCNVAAQVVSCTRADVLNAGASYPAITLTVNVVPAAPSSLTNTAQVSGGGEINAANNTASNITTIGPGPDLTITKGHSGNFTQGQTGATYTITVSNPGGAPTTGLVTVTDNVPAGLLPTLAVGAGWSCSIAGQVATCTRSDPLATGQSYPITLTVNVSGAPGSVTNAVGVSGGGDVNPANNSATDVTTILSGADLTITKSHTGNFTQGQTGATYTVTVTNSGVGPTAGMVTVTDILPSGLAPTAAVGTGWSCTVGAQALVCSRNDVLGAGASYPSITITLNVAPNAPATVANIVAISGGGDTNAANNSASDATTIVPGPDLIITKTHGGNFTQGQPGTYSLTVANTGGTATSGSVTVTDNVPVGLVPTSAAGGGWTCNIAAQGMICNRSDVLAPGSSYPPITLMVVVATNAAASVTNTAVVFGGGEVNPSNNTASDLTTINAGPDLTITKTHSGNFTQGQNAATYTLTVGNAGGAPTIGTVTVTDGVPVGLVPTAAAGAGWICNIAAQGVTCTRSDPLAPAASYPAIALTVSVQSDASASVTNTATVSGGGDVGSSNNSASDSTTIIAAADLTLAKTHVGNFTQGQLGAMYTLTVSNVGSGPSSGAVTVTDTLPAGLTPTAAAGTGWACNIAAQAVSCTRADALNAGASYPAITLTVNVAPAAPSSLTNTARVSGGAGFNTANNTATDVATIAPGTDLTITKSHTGNFTQGQAGATYIVTITNSGVGSTSGSVTVTDNVPIGLVPTSAAGTGWACNIAAQAVICNRSDSLAPGQSYPAITLAVSVQPDAPASVTNTAVVSAGGDVNSGNNSASDPTTIIATAVVDLTLAKTHTGSFLQGQVGATYTLTVSNIGGSPTSGSVTVNDSVPAGLTPTAAAGAGWTCSIAGQVVTCSRSDALPAGSSYPPVTLTVNVALTAPPIITNTATVAGGGDATPDNGTASDVTTIVAAATATATVIPTLRGSALVVLLLLIAAIGAGFLRVRARVHR